MFDRHQFYMQQALSLAQKAEKMGEVPVAALLVKDNKIIGQGFNRPINSCDPTAHAEIMALREGGKALKNYRLLGSTLYVTLEPCAMCAAAMVHARIEKVIFAASDPKTGVVSSVMNFFDLPHLNHVIQWQGGVLAEQSSELLRDFFRRRRT